VTDELQRQAWLEHLKFEPEEARMLGLAAVGRKSLARLNEQIDFYRGLTDAPEHAVSPALRRLARLAVRRFDRGEEHASLERSLFPRLTELPDAEGYVAELVTLLREGLKRGAVAPVEIVEHFCANELPMIVGSLDANSVWQRLYALTRDELLLAARALGPDRWRLGEDEYAWRLANMGLREDPATIANEAQTCLREQQARIAELLGFASFADALPRLREITSVKLGPGEVVPLHRAATARCVEFVRTHGLFELPEGFEVPVTLVPPELAAVTHAGNNPAPLFGDGGGSFAVLDVPERHRRAWVVPLAVHEGVPGHYLQSWLWQRQFRAQGAAPNFVSFADPIAAERQDWGAMPAIEGWAVYAEDLLLQAGFHAPEQAVAVANFHAIRCVRAIVDVGLHTRGWTRDDAARMLVEEVGLDLAEAGRELLRSIRIPTQPLTYFAGWRAIATLVRDSGLPLAEAHRRLLAAGPTLPRSLA
jgi:hypothetical protein